MVRIVTAGAEPSPGSRKALVLPGQNYTARAPLLYWSTAVLVAAGWTVRIVEWDDDDRQHDSPEALIDHVFEVDAAETSGAVDLVVAKSLGTLALPRCVEQGIAGVWLTPLLNRDAIVAALRAADECHLAIGGSRDRLSIPEAVQGTDAEILTFDGADHAMLRDDWRESMSLSYEIADRTARHLDRV